MKRATTPKLSKSQIELLDAAKHGELGTIKRLLAQGVAVDTQDNRSAPWDVTPLMYAAGNGHLEVVRGLLAAGASVKAKDRHVPGETGGRTALHYAAEGKHLSVVRELIAAGADVNVLATGSGGTPLFSALVRNQGPIRTLADAKRAHLPPAGQEVERILGVMKCLLAAGADPNIKDRGTGSCPLDMAASLGAPEIVQTLLEAEADPYHQDAVGSTAFDTAAAKGRVAVASLLLAKGLRHEQRDKDGWTHLMWAVAGKSRELVSRLIEAGAPLNEVNKEGHTALDLAIRNSQQDLIALLKEAGAKLGGELGKRRS